MPDKRGPEDFWAPAVAIGTEYSWGGFQFVYEGRVVVVLHILS